MNKAELISLLAEKSNFTKKDTEVFLSSFVESVTEVLATGGDINLMGFGKFSVVERPERQGTNPQTLKPMTIKASRNAKFKVGKGLKDTLNEK